MESVKPFRLLNCLSRFAAACLWLMALVSAAEVVAQDPTALKEQARAIYKQGDYARAVEAYVKAVDAATKSFGASDQRTDIVVNELAISYLAVGKLTDAANNFQRVLRNTEGRMGPNDPEVATCLNNLGRVYDAAGDYEQEETLAQRSYQILVSRYGENHHYLATNVHNLAGIAANRGNDAEAVRLYRRALALYESAPGNERDEDKIANTLNSLAVAHGDLGQVAEATAAFQRALASREARLGKDHPSVAITLNNMAVFNRDQKKYAEAEQLYRRSLEIRRQKLGADHPAVATTLSNLAIVYSDQGRYAEAEKLLVESLQIREKKLEADHPSIAVSLNNIAVVYLYLNQPDQAEAMFQRSLKINRAKYGAHHPQVAVNLKTLGLLHARQERWEAVLREFDEARHIVRNYVSQVLPALSEREQLNFLKLRDESALHSGLSLGLLKKTDLAFVERTSEWLANSKGISQQVVAQKSRVELDQNDPAIGRQVTQLQNVQREIAYLLGSTKQDEATRLKEVENLREQERQLSAEITKLSGRPVQDNRWIELAEIRGKLPKKSVLVDVARFRVRNVANKNRDDMWLPAHYVAWIVPPAGVGQITLVDLGPAEAIEAQVRTARSAIVSSREIIKDQGDVEAEQKLLASLSQLATSIFTPLEAHFGEANRIILCPDAALWLVPWAALPLKDKSYAIEKYEISYVVSSRDLFTASAKTTSPPIVFADPDYDLQIVDVLAAVRGLFRDSGNPRMSRVKPTFQLPKVPRLPYTAVEAEAISPKLQSYAGVAPILYTGEYALETAIRHLQRPKALVVSTHGYFREDQRANVADDDNFVTTPRTSSRLENPLLRCGLLLAGSNTRDLATRSDADDGVLTGQEIVGIDLRSTDLVVLSACETGLGEVQNGEGVAGLRQAFQLAGARTVASTLWEIPDTQTARLMNKFFGDLADGQSPAAALRNAQLSLIENRRNRVGAAHPFFWAAFTVTGAP